MWTRFSDPFGTDAANTKPAGAGAFAYNLRFPGQYFDAESGLNYNNVRDYDPSSGRYVESDPIGLSGCVNTYIYARANPIHGLDPLRVVAAVIGHSAADVLGRLINPNSTHTAIWMSPDHPCRCDVPKDQTLGAQRESGNLVTHKNYEDDAAGNAEFVQYVSPPGGMSDCDLIKALLAATARYKKGPSVLIPQNLLRGGRTDGEMPPAHYNSNSYVEGLLAAVGVVLSNVDTGGDYPLPGFQP
jgi:RHS repeat-associated protein